MSRQAAFFFSILTLFSVVAKAQTAAGLPEQINSPGYDPAALFAPGFYGDLHLATRTPNGAPSSAYWQNRADYTLSVRLDTTHNEIEGSASIRYTNNSPDSLHTLWLYLDQQTYRADARSNYFTGYAPTGHTDGYELSSVKVQQGAAIADAEYSITDTRLQIRLKQALPGRAAASTSSSAIGISYPETLATGRTGLRPGMAKYSRSHNGIPACAYTMTGRAGIHCPSWAPANSTMNMATSTIASPCPGI